jgi:hypothetical protein
MLSFPRLVDLKDLNELKGNNYPIITKTKSVLNIKQSNNNIYKKLNNFSDEDELSFYYDNLNDTIKLIWITQINNLTKEYLILKEKLINNELFEKKKDNTFCKYEYPIKLSTEYLPMDVINQFLLLNKISENSPLKKVSINLLKDLKINKNKFNKFKILFSFEKENDKKKIISELLGVNIKEKIVHKDVYKRKSILYKRVNNNKGITIIDDEEVFIQNPNNYNVIKPVINKKKKFSITKKVSSKFNELEYENNENTGNRYIPAHKRNMSKHYSSYIELYISGYPDYTTENELVDTIENCLYKEFGDKRFIKSVFFKKKQTSQYLNCFSFVKLFEKKYADFLINNKLVLHSGILIVSMKEKN